MLSRTAVFSEESAVAAPVISNKLNMPSPRALTPGLSALFLVNLLSGCAVPAPNQRIYQCVGFQTDERLGTVYDVGFEYGRTMSLHRMTVGAIRAGVFCIDVPVPDHFEVSWKTADGSIHIADVPVRERLIRRPKPQLDLIFVIHPDGVAGYIEDDYNHRRIFVDQKAKVVAPLTD
jgi:hypothetical protein